MQSASCACEAARILRRIAEGGVVARGFDEFQVLQALKLMVKGPTGRPTLERVVGIGEASAKTLIKCLREEGLITKCGVAHCATEKGASLVRALRDICVTGPCDIGLTGELERGVIVVSSLIEPPLDVVDVHEVRDYLVARSCKPVIIGAYWPPETIRFPGVPPEVEEKLKEKVVLALNKVRCILESETGAVLVVAPAKCSTRAAAALLSLLADECSGKTRFEG
jgi:hypothetical protein